MADTREHAAAIRAELKKRGWNGRAVSVRMETFSMGSSINVVIKSASVPIAAVREIAKAHESVSRCSVTGEILGGGNMYVDVKYAAATINEMAAPIAAQLLTIVDAPRGTAVVLPGGFKAFRTDEPGDYWRALRDGEPQHKGIYCWGRDFCARQIAEKLGVAS